jgi:hypothetical protein
MVSRHSRYTPVPQCQALFRFELVSGPQGAPDQLTSDDKLCL